MRRSSSAASLASALDLITQFWKSGLNILQCCPVENIMCPPSCRTVPTTPPVIAAERVMNPSRAALHQLVRVKQVKEDTLIVYSKNLHQMIESIQIFDFPYLNEGPWFVFASSDVLPTQHGTLAPKSGDALLPFEDWNSLRLELSGDGTTLIVHRSALFFRCVRHDMLLHRHRRTGRAMTC
jgi:hypothetical protein